MVIVLIVVGLFVFEIIIGGLWSSIFKREKSPPPILKDRGLAYKYYKRAYELQTERKWKEASEEYSQAIKFNTKQAEYFNNRGLCYYFLEQYERACSDFTSAIEINSGEAIYYEHRGDVYLKLGKKYYGLTDLRKAVALGSSEAKELIAQHEKEERERVLREQMDKNDDLPF